MMKTCTKCLESFEATPENFHRNKSAKGGLKPRCKNCHKADGMKWKQANPDRHLANSKEWALANPERVKANQAAWYQAHLEYAAAQSKKRREDNPEKARSDHAAWAQANPERLKDIQKKWRQANPEKVRLKVLMSNAKERVKKTGGQVTIDESHIDLAAGCPGSGKPFAFGVGQPCDDSPSLDRIDNNNRDYSPANTWVISHRFNRIKSDTSFEEFEAMYLAWKAIREEKARLYPLSKAECDRALD